MVGTDISVSNISIITTRILPDVEDDLDHLQRAGVWQRKTIRSCNGLRSSPQSGCLLLNELPSVRLWHFIPIRAACIWVVSGDIQLVGFAAANFGGNVSVFQQLWGRVRHNPSLFIRPYLTEAEGKKGAGPSRWTLSSGRRWAAWEIAVGDRIGR